MKKTENFEVIIIGAGLSGLTLAKEICDRTNYKILILEKKKKFKFDKNWCFWNRPENPFTNNFDHAWEKISVNIDGKEKILHDKNIKYLHLKSSSFYQKLINDLKKKKVIIKMNQKIKYVLSNKEGFNLIKSENSVFKSKFVFDSRPKKYLQKKNLLFQHFYGAEILFKKPLIDKDKVTLMDFQNFNNGIHFLYILPFSSKKALFETTYFSTKILNDRIYKLDIKKYLKKKFPNQKYESKFIEKGIIPMFYTNQKSTNKNVINIGTPGNWVRASTGYSFQNAFIISKEITDKLLEKKKLKTETKKIIKFLDKVFCYYIANYSYDSKKFFKSFFLKNKFKDIVSFLTGEIKFFKMVLIILSLPKKKLLFSMFKSIKNN